MSTQVRQVFLISIRARPTNANECHIDTEGAQVNCWIESASEQDAVAIAEAAVREAAWHPEAVLTIGSVMQSDYANDVSGRGYYEQALLDGVVLVFHTWP